MNAALHVQQVFERGIGAMYDWLEKEAQEHPRLVVQADTSQGNLISMYLYAMLPPGMRLVAVHGGTIEVGDVTLRLPQEFLDFKLACERRFQDTCPTVEEVAAWHKDPENIWIAKSQLEAVKIAVEALLAADFRLSQDLIRGYVFATSQLALDHNIIKKALVALYGAEPYSIKVDHSR
jgi:hypothetical protein